ncbi:MAG: LexA family transcriptional regulator [Firmicutes bacterium]|nr:LexA family transcriptional regulator [Bacillota bacterium]
MDDFQKRVYILTIEKAMGNEKLTHFAQRAGISAGNLSRIRKGQIATPGVLKKIAEASSFVDYEELMRVAGFGAADILRDSGALPVRRGVIRIPIVSELNQPKEKLLTDESLPCEEHYAANFPEAGDYIFFVANDNAFVPCGSRVLVDLSKEPSLGDIVLFVLDGQTMLRRLTKNGRSYFYYGDNLTQYPMTPVKKSHMQIYGVAVQANIFL